MTILPPQNINIEKVILSCILNNNKKTKLKKEDFYLEKHQTIYSAIQRLETNDVAILGSALEKTGQLKEIGGRTYLMELHSQIYLLSNLEKYVDEIKRLSIFRQLQVKMHRLSEDNLEQDKKEIENIFAQYENIGSKDLVEYNEEDKIVLSHDRWEEIQKEPELPKIKSLIPSLDKKFECFEGGEMIIISGPEKSGKTSFAQTLTLNFSNQDIMSLWFTYEMREKAIFKKMPKDINGHIPTFVLPKTLKNDDISWIEERIIESILKYQIRVVFIDHLGFIVDAEKSKDKRLEVDSIVRKIKNIARQYNILIFVIHHIKKIEPWTIPTKDHLKESSSPSQDSDGVIMIWRDFEKQKRNEYKMTGNTVCAIEHSRRSGEYKGRIYLQYNQQKNLFMELMPKTENFNPYYNKI